MSILKQGNSIIPTPHTVDEFYIRCDFEKSARRLRLSAHFHENPIKEQSQPCNALQPTQSTIRLNVNDLRRHRRPLRKVSIHDFICSYPNAELTSTTFYVTMLLLCIVTLPVNRNAIKRLQERKDIVTKPADKGGAIVLWCRDLSFQEALRQISITDFCHPIANDTTPHQQHIITATVAEVISHKSLPSSANNLIEDNPMCAMFNLLPKIHKIDNPGRPIVSTINSPTELISQYLDCIYFSLVTKLPTFIKNISDVIRLCRNFKFTVDYLYCYLFTMDICSPYITSAQQ